MEIGFTATETNEYNVTITGLNKSIQKCYLVNENEPLIMDDFFEIGVWNVKVKLNENIIFEIELTNKETEN